MTGIFKRFARRRERERLERAVPNPRSATPRGNLAPAKRENYTSTVVKIVAGRMLLVAALVAFAVWLLRVFGDGTA